jgi:hypothetical protein
MGLPSDVLCGDHHLHQCLPVPPTSVKPGPHFGSRLPLGPPTGRRSELTASTGVHQEMMDSALSKPHDALARWQAAKPS